MTNFDMVTLVLTLIVSCFIVEGFILGILAIFNSETSVIAILTNGLPVSQSNLFTLFLKIFYLFIVFFAFTSLFVYLMENLGILFL